MLRPTSHHLVIILTLTGLTLLGLLALLAHHLYRRHRKSRQAREATTAEANLGPLDEEIELAEGEESFERVKKEKKTRRGGWMGERRNVWGIPGFRDRLCRQHASKTARKIEVTENVTQARAEDHQDKGKKADKGNKLISNGNGLAMTEEEWQEVRRIEIELKEKARKSAGLE
ncbi:MAG: hypothetical protein Q9210_002461 [Variospora velana]